MLLNQFFAPKKLIAEGGNVSSQSPGWQGMPGDHKAEEIDLKIHNRDFMVEKLRELLKAQNESFAATYGRPIWDPKLLDSNQMFSGSSLTFFDIKGVNTQDFLNKLHKTKVGDIDTQVDQEIGEQITEWLKAVIGKQVGNGTFVGFNSSLSALWQLQDPPVKVQIDYELGPYEPAQGKEPARPTEWFAYSHSSDLADMEAGIKGVFHKWINRALTHAQATTKYVAHVLKKSVKISPEPVTDSDYSFAVTSAQGGGLSAKYKPYIDPQTGQPMEIDGIPVMQFLDTKQRDYNQNLDQQFQTLFGRKRTAADKKLQNSFVGTIQLMNDTFNVEQNDTVADAFIGICFGTGAQMITAGDPARDRDTKLAAIDYMVENLILSDAAAMRQQAIDLAMEYEAKFNARKGVKESINEAEVKAQLRKNMPHLNALKPIDFLDLLDEIHDGNGNFKLENIPLNVKVDGFGGRFGKNSEGRPFMATSNTQPRYEAGFEKYNIEKAQAAGVEPDPERLAFSRKFDTLFNEMMQAISMVDDALGPDFLVNKQVTCEVLFMPFAIPQEDGRLKFVGIHYDKLPEGVELALVPFRVVDATTGDDLPDAQKIVNAITNIGQQGSVMFINNRLTQKEGLDVTALLPPLENIEEIKDLLSSTHGKRDKASLEIRKQIEAQLQPIKEKLEQAIINDPNIIGKDMLGQDYEGIVINSRLGPIKITSQEQRDVIKTKMAAKAAARAEQPRENTNKTAVVAIGSFVGHIGHEQLWDYTIKRAKEVGGDPYLFMGNAVGKDDPIPVETKLQTWHKMYPEYANNISATQVGGSLMQKIKHELINPLPGKLPRYDNIIIMVGSGEEESKNQLDKALMKAVNKFPGYEHVTVTKEMTPRGTGMSFTKLRNILKDPNATEQEQLDLWTQAFDVNKLGVDWIKSLMDITRKGMGIQMPLQQQTQQPVPERLLNALIMPQLNEARQSAAVKLQRAFNREQEKSASERKRGEEVMTKARQDAAWEKTKQTLSKPENIGVLKRLSQKESMAEGELDETLNPAGIVAGAIRWAVNNPAIVAALGVAGAGAVVASTGGAAALGPMLTAATGVSASEVGMGLLTLDKLKDLIQTNSNQAEGWFKQQIYKYIGDEEDAKEFELLHAKTAYLGKDRTFRWRAKEWPVTLQRNDAEAFLEKADKYWLEQEIQKQKDAEKAQQQELPIQHESSGGAKYKVKSIGKDKKGDYYISPNTGKKVYKKANVGDHETPSGEVKPKVGEAMLPKSAFAGSSKNKLGTAGQWNQSKKRPAKAGDLVGGAAESIENEDQRLDPKCWKGYRKAGTKMKGGTRVNNCVPVREDVENIIGSLVEQLSRK